LIGPVDREPRLATLRRPTEADHGSVAAVIDEWFGGRRMGDQAARSWFRHVASTSWLAADANGRPIGLLLGYRSQDHPDEAVLHLLAVDPNHRRRGVARTLVEAFADDLAARGARHVVALAWPGDPPSTAFFGACGFAADTGEGSQNLFGMPAYPDFEAPGDDRIVFRRSLPRA
jgi:ribosomal protein S18 acetylase RimI-like enzyme